MYLTRKKGERERSSERREKKREESEREKGRERSEESEEKEQRGIREREEKGERRQGCMCLEKHHDVDTAAPSFRWLRICLM